MWLNRRRRFHRDAEAVRLGIVTALGLMDPGTGYWQHVSDGIGEARLLKAQQDAIATKFMG